MSLDREQSVKSSCMALRLIWAAACAAVISIAAPAAQSPETAPASIELFTPQGSSAQVSQVVVRFSQDMVALGDAGLADPFDIQCDHAGAGRWADQRNWVYDFEQQLPAGSLCQFTVRKTLTTLSGAALTGPQQYRFNTGGPSILRSLPYKGSSHIDEEQIFLLKLDAAASLQSVLAHARCAVSGIGEEIPVEVITGAARLAVLRQHRADGYSYLALLWSYDSIPDSAVRERQMAQQEADILVLRCQRRLPPESQLTLLWGAGIESTSGIARTARQRFQFKVRPVFTAQVQCTRSNAQAGCLPMLPIRVQFTDQVPRDLAMAARLKLPNGKLLAPVAAEAGQPTVQALEFAPSFPELQTVSVQLPAGLVDDEGRPLDNAQRFPVSLRIDEAPPLVKFSGTFGILEHREGGVLPVTVRNVEAPLTAAQAAVPAVAWRFDKDPLQILNWMRRVDAAGQWQGSMMPAAKDGPDNKPPILEWVNETGAKSVFGKADEVRNFNLPRPSGHKAFEVIGIPLKDPGFYVVEVQSRLLGQSLLGRDAPRYVATSALVTDLAVHLKWGRSSSVVWVTQLHDGAPVPGAAITVLDYCKGSVLWEGTTGADGLARIPRQLGTPHSYEGCNNWHDAPLFVAAKTPKDMGFTLSHWDQGIEPGQFNLPLGSEAQSRLYHTVLDRTLYRAGDTVSMKHFFRVHSSNGFEPLTAAPGLRSLILEHQGSGQKYALVARFDEQGIAENEWKIPVEAKLGTYSITIKDAQDRTVRSGEFRVEQFRLPSMRASINGSPTALVLPRSLDLSLQVAYMAGGGAGGLPVKVRTLVETRELSFADYRDYRFGGKRVVEGLVRDDNGSQGEESDYEADAATAAVATPDKARVIPLTLDGSGAARVTVPDLPTLDEPATLTAELEYADANGETLTSSTRVQLLPADVSVGIRREGWAGSSKQLRLRVVVLDLKGKPVARRPVAVTLYARERYSFRKRLLGGFYAYESSTKTQKIASHCQGDTDAQGLLSCELAPGVSGEVLIRAETTDSAGRPSGATDSAWLFNGDQNWFGGTSGDRMDVLPEKSSYESGDTARLQVRMPFREATALVTVERQGVMSSFVTHIDGNAPVVDVPVAAPFAPNVFISVLAVRGRVPHTDLTAGRATPSAEITALVDLNKPAYRLGIAAIKVGWKPHRLDVSVTADRPVYKTRESAQVRIHATRADGGQLPAGTEVVVAAVDAALLDLSPNNSWDLLPAMMGERGLEVRTSTAQMQVVGKRHYGRKAVPAGGGGGRTSARELFDPLLLWKGRVVLDSQGNAQVAVPFNDSLSEFRIVAVASGGAGFFGTGSTTVNTTQDLMLMSGLPPLVREGDEYLATFNVRNASTRALKVEVSGSKVGQTTQPLTLQRIELGAGQSRNVAWKVSAPFGVSALQWEVQARAVDASASDRLRVTEQVIPAVMVRTYQSTIEQIDSAFSLPVQQPAAATPGRGGLELTLRTRLGDGLQGVREYLQNYPYVCLEQQTSRAVGLRDTQLWATMVQRLPAYLDADGLLRYYPTDRLSGDDVLTAYVLQMAHEAGWALPDGARDRMLDALTRFVQGKLSRSSALQTADLTVRKLAAIEALSRYQRAEGSMLDSLNIDMLRWPTSAVLDYIGILRRVPGPTHAARLKEAEQLLRSRLNFQGSALLFSTERSDALWWLMISGDSNANRLLLTMIDQPSWQADIARLVRGSLLRQKAGHWNTTVANAWGVLALEKFSAKFESVAVSGSSVVQYGSAVRPLSWPADRKLNEVSLPWQPGPGKVQITHQGTGKPWVIVRATAALPGGSPVNSGYSIRRTLTPIEQQRPGRWSRGDVLRVHLELVAKADMSWVVVDEPVPAGASFLGTGLGGQSNVLARGESKSGGAWLAYEERRFEALRSYYRYVPKGTWSVDYTLRLNNPGTFQLPATRVEAMYAPEVMGELPNGALTVEP